MKNKLQEAIGSLADMYEYFELRASTDPVALLNDVYADVEGMRRRLGGVREWADTYGGDLCPGERPDTYGEGVRAAKQQVRFLLTCGEPKETQSHSR